MQNVFLLVTEFTVTSIPVYRNYLYERLGAHLIFYLSEGGVIRGGCSLKPWFLSKKYKVGTS